MNCSRSAPSAGCLAAAIAVSALLATDLAVADSELVEFNRDVRPIFSDRCFTCHGPDVNNRKTPLRFDTEKGATQDLGGHFAIIAGQPDKSTLIERIASDDPVRRMPPSYEGHTRLSETDIDTIRRWVEQGAKWQEHWSFVTPTRPRPPAIGTTGWPQNSVDNFVLARLEREGLAPSPEADRATLIRRVTLDLTGLPPAPEEVDDFVNDASPEAYDKVVDRLLQSPRYGERMAIRWLDAARYADTNGYQTDAERYMWRWRDWVIEAFNNNMAFDQFTVEQIAGDLLPNPTLDQLIATGFNRNHRGNGEGGIIAEEYAVEYVVDRVETTSTVWLGLTMGCARCHDHKYDPLTQKEFYKVFAYFNNVPENGKAFKYGNSPPFMQAPTREQQKELKELDKKLAEAKAEFASLDGEIKKAQAAWEKAAAESRFLDWSLHDGLIAHYGLDGNVFGETPGSGRVLTRLVDGGPDFVKGKIGQAARFDGKRFVDGGDVAPFRFQERFTLSAWIYPAASNGPIVTRTKQGSTEKEGYGLYLKDGKVQLNLVARWLDDSTRVETAQPLKLNRWYHVVASYDGSRLADGTAIYVNGKPWKLTYVVDGLNQPFGVKAPIRIGAVGNAPDRFRGDIDEVRIYDRKLTRQEVAALATSTSVGHIARAKPNRRTPGESEKLRLSFLDQYAPENIREAWLKLTEARKKRAEFVDRIPTVMVMKERESRRQTHVLVRGAYDKPGEKVSPGVPAVLPPIDAKNADSRLGFARWLVDGDNPLTARVTVNRFWQMYFGTGLVRTVEDFGSQGEWPTHLSLLDWLAVEFVESGWDVKSIQKKIVMSAAYRQSSRVPPELLKRDPSNRFLARGPRLLAISGLLVDKIGGPSVKPYQPVGLWTDLAGGKDYEQDHGEKLYRRSLYTFWKRAVPPPSMLNFDSAGREACSVRESRTNTPLQALNLMNDVTFIEASRLLAERMMTEGGPTARERIGYGYKLATAQELRGDESRVLLRSLNHYRDNFATDRKSALDLVRQGEHLRNEVLDAAELASYTTVASLILNLDETITKE